MAKYLRLIRCLTNVELGLMLPIPQGAILSFVCSGLR